MLNGQDLIIVWMKEASTLLDWMEAQASSENIPRMRAMGVLPILSQLHSIVGEWRERVAQEEERIAKEEAGDA